jgi:hypothetical protein
MSTEEETIELSQNSEPYNSLNESWITARIILDVIEEVIRLVSKTIADTQYQQLHTISLRKLIEETAYLVGSAICCRFNIKREAVYF